MKIDKSRTSAKAERVTGVYAKACVSDASPATPLPSIVEASLLGIPESEFTPRVRSAITTLMHEVDRLKRELTQTKEKLDDLARAADQDTLLPILNRRAFVREITRCIALAERYGTPSSLLYFDLDHFKEVNDAYGHAAGDVVLRHFSDLLQSQIRESDILARLGGDEFGIILVHVNLEQAMKKGANLAKQLRDRPAMMKGEKVKLSFSYGAYELRAGEDAALAMALADQAMYAQKRGR